MNLRRRLQLAIILIVLTVALTGCLTRAGAAVTPSGQQSASTGSKPQASQTFDTTGTVSPPGVLTPLEEVVVGVHKGASPGVVNISTSLISTDLFLQGSFEQATG